jgi:hypothetical protein
MMTGLSRMLLLSAACWTLLSAVPVQAQDDIVVNVSLNRDTIGLDEQAVLTVSVSGTARNLPPPRLPTLSMFEVYDQGQSTNISIINGQMSSEVSQRYVLLPTKPGVFPIKNIAVVHNNKRYKGNDVELTVLDQGIAAPRRLEEKARDSEGGGKEYFLEADVDNEDPYVSEQVTLTLRFYIAIRHSTPEITFPTTTGFWQETISSNTVYNQRLNGREYKVYEIKAALFPTRTGKLTIGRALITAWTPRKSMRRGFPFRDFFGLDQEQLTARSRPLQVNVKSLPIEGKPADFTGTVGKFDITAHVDKTSVEVNQPVTVTIRISGTGDIKSAAEPIIPEMDEFRVYRASSKENITKVKGRIGGTKIFEEVFRPKYPGTQQIPAIGYDYFNPETGRYHSVSTRPITIDVEAAEGYASTPDVPYAPSGVTIGNQPQDIRYVKKDIGDLTPIGSLIIVQPTYLLLNGIPVLFLLVGIAVRLRRRKLRDDAGYARSRAASKLARKRLARARSLAKTETSEQFYAEISQTVTSYVADKLNISPYGLTSDRISELLREKGAEPELIDQTASVLQRSDFARFAPSSVSNEDMSSSLATAEDVMVKMGGVKFG